MIGRQVHYRVAWDVSEFAREVYLSGWGGGFAQTKRIKKRLTFKIDFIYYLT